MSRLRGNKKTYAQEHKRMRIQMERLGILSNVDIGKMDVCVRRKQRLRNKKKRCAEERHEYVTFQT